MWTPGPIAIVVNPTTIVIRCPTPGFITNPRPPIRRNPGPMSVAVRRPVVVGVNDGDVRSPDPTVIVGIGPTAVGVEIFPAPDGVIKVTHVLVILQSRGQIAFAINDPI